MEPVTGQGQVSPWPSGLHMSLRLGLAFVPTGMGIWKASDRSVMAESGMEMGQHETDETATA